MNPELKELWDRATTYTPRQEDYDGEKVYLFGDYISVEDIRKMSEAFDELAKRRDRKSKFHNWK
jgi:hypothetical protein